MLALFAKPRPAKNLGLRLYTNIRAIIIIIIILLFIFLFRLKGFILFEEYILVLVESTGQVKTILRFRSVGLNLGRVRE